MSDGPDEAIDVLLIDDDPADERRIRDSFVDLEFEVSLRVASDGETALSLLRATASDPSTVPDLILLDLDVPRVSGLELLEAVERESALVRLPILVLTRSASVEDVRRCYELPANAYLRKPTDPDGYADLVRAIADFWFGRVTLPTRT